MKSMLLSFFPILLGFFVTQCGSNNVMPSFDQSFMINVTENSSFDALTGLVGGVTGIGSNSAREKVGISVGKGMMAELLSSWHGIAFLVFLGIIVLLLFVLVIVLARRRGGGNKH